MVGRKILRPKIKRGGLSRVKSKSRSRRKVKSQNVKAKVSMSKVKVGQDQYKVVASRKVVVGGIVTGLSFFHYHLTDHRIEVSLQPII